MLGVRLLLPDRLIAGHYVLTTSLLTARPNINSTRPHIKINSCQKSKKKRSHINGLTTRLLQRLTLRVEREITLKKEHELFIFLILIL